MERILQYINNYFAKTRERGKFKIVNNTIRVKGQYLEGQYILIKGSVMNDGITRVESVEGDLIRLVGATGEEFEGFIYGLAIPKQVVALNDELIELEKKFSPGIYSSESFGNYSYNLAINRTGEVKTAFDVAIAKLVSYRRIYETSLEKAKEV